jgi:hypothetical protein
MTVLSWRGGVRVEFGFYAEVGQTPAEFQVLLHSIDVG